MQVSRMLARWRSIMRLAVLLTIWMPVVFVSRPAFGQTPAERLQQLDLAGGLVVYAGPADTDLIAALRLGDGYRVWWLDADARRVAEARRQLVAARQYGPISVSRYQGGALPLIDNVVNVLFVDASMAVPPEEIRRVLCPGGVAFTGQGSSWRKTVKPRSEKIDVWTHFLYDSSNNAVAQDDVIDVPRRLQWTGGPRYSRHHDHMASVSAMVSNGPQVFYIIDMGSRWSIEMPADWKLIARDAFNGTTLWTKDMGRWFTHHYSLKSGPGDLPRRLVAVGSDVFFTPALDAPLEKVDAVSGRTVKRYEQTAATEEIIYDNGVLFLKVNDPENQLQFDTIQAARNNNGGVPFNLDPRRVMAVDAESGETLWQRASVVMPATLAADAKHVYYHDGEAVVCLDRRSGDPLWTRPVSRWSKMQTFFTPTLVVYDGIVLFAGGEKMIPHRGGKDSMTALDAKTGEVLWTAYHPQGGYMSAEDVLVSGGLVWSGETTSGGYSGMFTGRDPKTGEVKIEFGPDVETYWFHHRCYRGKATEKYLLMSRTGVEFLDPRNEHWTINHWVRGGCLYGIMPCNGLIYAPPSNCACYPEIKLFGINALAPAADSQPVRRVPEAARLEKGPAYTEQADEAAVATREDWPTYRGDNGRSGSSPVALPAELKRRWQIDLGHSISPPVIADGSVYVTAPDAHTVFALSAQDGQTRWTYTAGGRIDSPPTFYRDRVYFGSADGSVHCLRASDGQLVWRYLAAPSDRRLVAYDQVESLWPVRGSVLIERGRLYTIAGRNLFLDGGLRLVILDPLTGQLLGENWMDDTDPQTGENLQSRVMILNMPTGINDILSSDDNHLYWKSQVLDWDGTRGELGPHSGEPARQGSVQRGDTAHLYAPFDGFLDGDWFHRSYWVYGRSFAGGHSGYHQAGKYTPAGRILVFDEQHVYGFGRKPQYYRWTTPLEHQLFCANKVPRAPRLGRKGELLRGVQVLNTPALNPAGKPLVVEAWVKAEKPNGVIVARGAGSQGFALLIRQGTPRFVVRSDQELAGVVARKTKVVGQWHHLAGMVTADGKLKIYVDGELVGTNAQGHLIAGEPVEDMEIGSDEGGVVGEYKRSLPFTGLIDEVKIYFGALRDEQIARQAASSTAAPAAAAQLVFHAPFDDGKATDASGAGNHGTAAGLEAVPGRFGQALRFRGGSNYFVVHQWTRDVPLLVRAMAKADDRLFIMGPPDLLDEDAAFTARLTPQLRAQLKQQDEANRGKQGTVLMTVAADTGDILAQQPFAEMPRWDGMAVARGRLYIATEGGKLLCLGE